jgi:cobalt/nickel transport system permease protein
MIFILGIGIFQPFLYRGEVFRFSGLVFTYGWLSFISITLKSLFMVSMTLLLVMTSGFYVLLNHLRKLKVPKLFILLLMMIYRYLFLLVDEFHKMQQAYFLRSGQKRFHLKDIGSIFGHVLIRSFNRSQDVHYAMMLRGLEDEICLPDEYKITFKDIVIALLLMALICGIRFIPVVKIGHIVIGG